LETPLQHILTHSYKVGVIAYIQAHPEDFEEAIELSISDKHPYCWRAASLLWNVMEDNDIRIKPYLKKIIDTIAYKKDGHMRELLKVLLKMELDDEFEGIIFNFCMETWEKINKQPSVRYVAFQFIIKTVKRHPELSKEVAFLTQNQYIDPLSPGAKNSILRMIKKL
jgi:hypothetical protein